MVLCALFIHCIMAYPNQAEEHSVELDMDEFRYGGYRGYGGYSGQHGYGEYGAYHDYG